MRGSGIYSQSWSGEMFCDACDKDVEVDGETDDWGYTAYATCPDCGADLEKEISDESEPDPDAAYDAWRDSQIEW